MPDERVSDQVPAFLQAESSFFRLEPRLKKGDIIEAEFFDEPMVVATVLRREAPGRGSRLSHQEIKLMTRSEWEASLRPESDRPNVTQNFHGTVGMVAGRDNNVSIALLLSSLADKIETDPKIPAEERRSIASRLRELAANPYVVGVATTVAADLIRGAITGG